MQTSRLRSLQQPSRVDELFAAFATSVDGVPERARKIDDDCQLGEALQRVAIAARNKQQTCGGWTDGIVIWFFTAELSLSLSRERGCPVLQVESYTEQGQLKDSASWACGRDGTWRRCAA